ncbi:TetR/AcrR family transcriptional regulator [Parashewanella curva]|uniref:TetR/AcrR family transcriptional regulator n=1 Tax=Parashewanella curva TaxID=2338552 RepID=A0A3L8Q134_9GAMM|nr:TetR/AcrR family transcriptional regulator [Parashewanella curva]RLV61295.1 TetR/AcrR family transcriptional regulator [Parashewanella curva]
MKTRDMVIHASLELFNEHGERTITTNHIAAHLGISPGNLYYHFANKQDIIQEIFSLFEKHINENIKPSEEKEFHAGSMMAYLDAAFVALWKFRFFYVNLHDILLKDDQLKKRYLKLQQSTTHSISQILQQMVNAGLLCIPAEDVERLADTIRILMGSWIGHKLVQSNQKEIKPSELFDGVSRMILIIKPYATEASSAMFSQMESRYQSLIAEDGAALNAI